MNSVGTVLVGKYAPDSDIAAVIVELGDEQDAEFGRSIDSTNLRQLINREWSLLRSGVLPEKSGEIAYKISRHSIVPGQVWTWIGCYKAATFAGLRDSTYFGYGILVFNGVVDAEMALDRVSSGIDLLIDRIHKNDGSMRPMQEIKGLPELCGPDLAVAPLGSGGLTVNGTEKYYQDVGSMTPARTRAVLLRLFSAAQTGKFDGYGHLLIGNSKRMEVHAISSHNSGQAAKDWPEEPVTEALAEAAVVSKKPSSAKPVPAVPGDNQPMADRDLVEALRDDVRRLETNFNEFAALPAFHRTPGSPPPGTATSRGGLRGLSDDWVLITLVAILAVIIVALLLGWIPTGVDGSQTNAAQPASTHATATPDATPNQAAENVTPLTPTCAAAPIPLAPLTSPEKQAIRVEQECLNGAMRALKDRKSAVDAALRRTR